MKIKAEIIISSSTTDEVIADIPPEKVNEWVKTGKWSQRHFLRWLKVLRVIE